MIPLKHKLTSPTGALTFYYIVSFIGKYYYKLAKSLADMSDLVLSTEF